jgi:hypothetical protein
MVSLFRDRAISKTINEVSLPTSLSYQNRFRGPHWSSGSRKIAQAESRGPHSESVPGSVRLDDSDLVGEALHIAGVVLGASCWSRVLSPSFSSGSVIVAVGSLFRNRPTA